MTFTCIRCLGIFVAALLYSASAYSQNELPFIVVGQASDELKSNIAKALDAKQLLPNQALPYSFDEQAIFASSFGKDSGKQPTIIVEQFEEFPSTSRLKEILDVLKKRESSATYLMLVDRMDQTNWASAIDVPDNVRLVVTAGALDKEEFSKFFEGSDLKYDGESIKVDHTAVLKLAISQITDKGKTLGYDLKPWSTGVAYAGIFDDIYKSSTALNDQSQKYVAGVLTGVKKPVAGWNSQNGVSKVTGLFDPSSNGAVAAVRYWLAVNQCSSSYKWDGMIDNEIELQAFGILGK